MLYVGIEDEDALEACAFLMVLLSVNIVLALAVAFAPALTSWVSRRKRTCETTKGEG
jgi:hypothetical protein